MITPVTLREDIKEISLDKRLKVFIPETSANINSMAEDVDEGLSSARKFLLPKYFYDEKGSELFEKICSTEEYYPTRTELQIIRENSSVIAGRNPEIRQIVELGSGTSYKTRFLLDSFSAGSVKLNYYPLDVSDIIIESSQKLIREFSKIDITAVVAFYEEGLSMVSDLIYGKKLILFLGSSIGNFNSGEAKDFLKMISANMNEGDILIVGFDMVKDKSILESAYNDSKGITAEFNLNILNHINNQLDADFDITKFRHKAFYNEGKKRIEMHLQSAEDQEIFIKKLNKTFKFTEGELIHTENSHKFDFGSISNLAQSAGLSIIDNYTDQNKWFSLAVFELKGEN